MGRFTFDIFNPGNDNDESLNRLTKEFAPLHRQAWAENKEAKWGRPYGLDVTMFATMWLQRQIRIILAYDGANPCGYIMGLTFRPMNYDAIAFQVEDWYSMNNRDVEQGLFDYLHDALRILGCNEVFMSYGKTDPVIQLGPEWRVATEMKRIRYVRG